MQRSQRLNSSVLCSVNRLSVNKRQLLLRKRLSEAQKSRYHGGLTSSHGVLQELRGQLADAENKYANAMVNPDVNDM